AVEPMSETSESQRHDLGPPPAEEKLPETVSIDGKRFFLTKSDGEFVLFSSDCPHRGGPVFCAGERFECPLHGWAFDGRDGERLDGGPGRLDAIDVVQRAGKLVACPSAEELERAHPEGESDLDTTPRVNLSTADLGETDEFSVNEETSVGDVLELGGTAARRILNDYGMRCLGCALAATESLRDAAITHCLSDDEFCELLDRLRSIDG
ncbi:MAG: Rieske 2Fe-2S domain-containing protein, partial [Bradymonadaceae bacterium]